MPEADASCIPPSMLTLCLLQALEHYSKAIELGYHHAVAYNNRAMARLKLKDFTGAEVDCDHVLLLDSGNVKALLRRASARQVPPHLLCRLCRGVIAPMSAPLKREFAVC